MIFYWRFERSRGILRSRWAYKDEGDFFDFVDALFSEIGGFFHALSNINMTPFR